MRTSPTQLFAVWSHCDAVGAELVPLSCGACGGRGARVGPVSPRQLRLFTATSSSPVVGEVRVAQQAAGMRR